MKRRPLLVEPEVYSTKECHDLVGGELIFKELLEKHPQHLVPLRQVKRGDTYYLKSVVMNTLLIAQASRSLIYKPQQELSHV